MLPRCEILSRFRRNRWLDLPSVITVYQNATYYYHLLILGSKIKIQQDYMAGAGKSVFLHIPIEDYLLSLSINKPFT